MVNAAVASALLDVVEMLKAKKGSKESLSKVDIHEVLQVVVKENRHLCFEGDGYSEEWVKEAERRGLPNLRNAIDAFQQLLKPENCEMLVKKTGNCESRGASVTF